MTKFLALVFFFFLFSVSPVRAERYGPTAAMHSGMAVDALRFAALRDTASAWSFRKCVLATQSSHFEAAARSSLLTRFSPAELAMIDQFNLSSAGVRYGKYNRDNFLAQHGAAPDQPTKLSADDVAALNRFEKTPVGARYIAELGRGPQGPADPLVIAIRQRLASCRQVR